MKLGCFILIFSDEFESVDAIRRKCRDYIIVEKNRECVLLSFCVSKFVGGGTLSFTFVFRISCRLLKLHNGYNSKHEAALYTECHRIIRTWRDNAI